VDGLNLILNNTKEIKLFAALELIKTSIDSLKMNNNLSENERNLNLLSCIKDDLKRVIPILIYLF
jgi:hypothetical protein